jgi:protein involved in polysaccharide export with SLBB domain
MPYTRLPRRSLRAFLLLLFSLSPGHLQAQTPPDSAAIVTPEAAKYRLGQGDVVAIRFFFNPELNDEMQIRPDGNVSLQLIGEYALAGRTVGDVTRDLQVRYAPEIKAPRITVQVRSFGSLKAYVTGEVQRPGAVSLIGGMDLVSAGYLCVQALKENCWRARLSPALPIHPLRGCSRSIW